MTREQQIMQALTDSLAPNYLSVTDESAKHRHHAGLESHFKVIISCAKFEGLSRIMRHRLVYDCLGNPFSQNKIHALALHTYTPEEWQTIEGKYLSSPACHRSDPN